MYGKQFTKVVLYDNVNSDISLYHGWEWFTIFNLYHIILKNKGLDIKKNFHSKAEP